MKNILNIGALIVFDSVSHMAEKRRKLGKDKRILHSYYFDLVGMNFMISSGHFLMFYIGLELATIPIAALAAYERYKNNSAEAGIKLILIFCFFFRNPIIRIINDIWNNRNIIFQ